jgi:hypothetical protein
VSLEVLTSLCTNATAVLSAVAFRASAAPQGQVLGGQRSSDPNNLPLPSVCAP